MRCLVVLSLMSLAAMPAFGQTYFYVGPDGGDFYDEANWNDAADGTGSPLADDPLVNSATNAIALDLVIDGASVEAAGQVDFGDGSLSLLGGATFLVSGADNALDMNSSSTFSLVDSTLTVDDDIFFEGTASFSGGMVTSLNDDIEFQDNLTSLTIDGTAFDAPVDNLIFDISNDLVSSISNATFATVDRLAIRNISADPTASIAMTNTAIDVNGGGGDVDDVFDTNNGNGAILILDGTSTLLANQVDDGISLVLGGSAVATLNTGAGAVDAANGGTITLTSRDAMLDIVNASSNDVRAAIFNAKTGLSYADDSSTWNVTDWDGAVPVKLQIVPEPSSWLLALLCVGGASLAVRRQA
ncbi:PEP-CTERM sorting domain-containing protein [Aeoliella sp.]|uniref:PEP-CTERM sorting domain-containing protein n=1 Tax=Aeoliella sp. TaxID=2795800 RepID=UPI003CCBE6EA